MKKFVTFGPSSEASASDHDEAEPKSLWYSKEELKIIKKEAKKIVSNSNDEDDPDICLRGLEPYQENPENRRNRLRHFVLSLLSVQSDMKEMNLDDPKGLQAFASAHSLRDCRAARRRGEQDAAAVEQCMGDDSNKEGKKWGASSSPRGIENKKKITVGAMCA